MCYMTVAILDKSPVQAGNFEVVGLRRGTWLGATRNAILSPLPCGYFENG